jgi:hypothetical protein
MTPSTMSFTTTSENSRNAVSSSCFGMRLVHTGDLTAKTEKTLKDVLEKTEKKFNIGSQWLSKAVSPGACGLSNQLIRSSILQNESLYSSEGLTLLSLDRLYSVKSALASYSRTRSHTRLEDAVDELRRYILANNGMKITKADLLRSYDWLNVKSSALMELDRMYRRAYGGPEQLGGISGISLSPVPAIVEPVIKSAEDENEDEDEDEDDDSSPLTVMNADGILFTKMQLSKPPTPRGPTLKLQTEFTKTTPISSAENKAKEDDTAKPIDGPVSPIKLVSDTPISRRPYNARFGSFLLSPDQEPASAQPGPLTPNGYDDISPITRGEWGFLMIDDAFQGRKTAVVETC